MRLTADLSAETLQATGEWKDIYIYIYIHTYIYIHKHTHTHTHTHTHIYKVMKGKIPTTQITVPIKDLIQH